MIGEALSVGWSCVRVGLLAFGGGNSAIPLLEAEVVPRWLTQTEYAELVSLNFGLPGISMLKLAGMVGLRAAGVLGLVAAVVGVAAPGLLLTIFAARLLMAGQRPAIVERVLAGMKAAAAALLLSAAVRMMPATSARGLVLGALVFVAVHFLKLHPALAILGAMIAGAAAL